MLYALCATAYTIVTTTVAQMPGLTYCRCGGWYNPASPAEWAEHKNH